MGTPIGRAVVKPLEQALRQVNFDLATVKLSDRLCEVGLPKDVLPGSGASPFERYWRYMNAALRFRTDSQSGGALALEAVRHLHEFARPEARRAALGPPEHIGVAYLFRSLMHHDEVARLRKLYDRQLFVISIFSPEDSRVLHLADVLAGTTGRPSEFRGAARQLVEREAARATESGVDIERLQNKRFLLNLPQTFQAGDLFVDISDSEQAAREVERFVQLIFRHPFHTPRAEEIGMADAFSAALESGNLARVVGAAICTQDGELLVTGTNDVPKPGGGVYRAGDKPDNRDASPSWGYDPSDRHRREILANFMRHLLADPQWLEEVKVGDPDAAKRLANALRAEATARQSQEPASDRVLQGAPVSDESIDYERLIAELVRSDVIWESEFFDVLEYGRTMHAEMDAITSAARKGISLRGSTLYCTTLPCHECARLIIGAGIQRVVFIEPYEKSRAYELYETEIEIKTLNESLEEKNPKRVHFIPYVGISPRRFQELFAWVPRKMSDVDNGPRALDGRLVDWERQQEELAALAPKLREDEHLTSPIIRESIISPSSFLSRARFRDLYEHEARTLNEHYGIADDPSGEGATTKKSTKRAPKTSR